MVAKNSGEHFLSWGSSEFKQYLRFFLLSLCSWLHVPLLQITKSLTMPNKFTFYLPYIFWGQFHQHSTHSFYVRKLRSQLFCAYVLGLHFTSVSLPAQKLGIERWWNWTRESILPNFDFFVFFRFLLLSLAILKYRQYFLMLQTLKLNNKKWKKSSF